MDLNKSIRSRQKYIQISTTVANNIRVSTTCNLLWSLTYIYLKKLNSFILTYVRLCFPESIQSVSSKSACHVHSFSIAHLPPSLYLYFCMAQLKSGVNNTKLLINGAVEFYDHTNSWHLYEPH